MKQFLDVLCLQWWVFLHTITPERSNLALPSVPEFKQHEIAALCSYTLRNSDHPSAR
jgi:hypothetical protein